MDLHRVREFSSRQELTEAVFPTDRHTWLAVYQHTAQLDGFAFDLSQRFGSPQVLAVAQIQAHLYPALLRVAPEGCGCVVFHFPPGIDQRSATVPEHLACPTATTFGPWAKATLRCTLTFDFPVATPDEADGGALVLSSQMNGRADEAFVTLRPGEEAEAQLDLGMFVLVRRARDGALVGWLRVERSGRHELTLAGLRGQKGPSGSSAKLERSLARWAKSMWTVTSQAQWAAQARLLPRLTAEGLLLDQLPINLTNALTSGQTSPLLTACEAAPRVDPRV